jgi:hypothetical protein
MIVAGFVKWVFRWWGLDRFLNGLEFVRTGNGKSKSHCRSFDCGTHDEAVSAFAQDDRIFGWVGRPGNGRVDMP